MMNKYFVKPLLLILAAILLVGVLSGCPAKKAPSTETTTAKDSSGNREIIGEDGQLHLPP